MYVCNITDYVFTDMKVLQMCLSFIVGLGLWRLTQLSVISCRSVLLVEEIEVPGEDNDKLLSHNIERDLSSQL